MAINMPGLEVLVCKGFLYGIVIAIAKGLPCVFFTSRLVGFLLLQGSRLPVMGTLYVYVGISHS